MRPNQLLYVLTPPRPPVLRWCTRRVTRRESTRQATFPAITLAHGLRTMWSLLKKKSLASMTLSVSWHTDRILRHDNRKRNEKQAMSGSLPEASSPGAIHRRRPSVPTHGVVLSLMCDNALSFTKRSAELRSARPCPRPTHPQILGKSSSSP